MPQVFHKATNTISKVTLGALVIVASGFLWLILAVQRSSWASSQDVIVVQPIQFSHERHVSGNGLDWRYCHASVEVAAFAGLPPTQTCMNCHTQVFSDAEYLEPVRESWRSGLPLAWRRVYDLPDHVFFNHGAHVTHGVGCTTCHGAVDRMPLVRQAVPLHMEWCLDCHRRPEAYLRPRDFVFSTTYVPPPDQEALGLELVASYGVRRLTDCYTCHR
jgi:hypothetical protein